MQTNEYRRTRCMCVMLCFAALWAAPLPTLHAQAFAPGLEEPFRSGIEPGDARLGEAPAGATNWYVDANAPKGGNGTFDHPFNSFEAVAGWVDEDGSYHAGHLQGSDVLYVKGVFSFANHSEMTNNMTITLWRGFQGGTSDRPTIIKSWPGFPRAVFDGAWLPRTDSHGNANALLSLHGNGATALLGAVVIRNIEVRRAHTIGIDIGESVHSAELDNLIVHDTKADGDAGAGGGIRLLMTDALHDFTVRNCLVYSNVYALSGNPANVSGLTILGESTAQAGSTVRLFSNEIYGEHVAIRHKHQGRLFMEAYGNLIHHCDTAFHLRCQTNSIHHNVLHSITNMAFVVSIENAFGPLTVDVVHNTVQAGTFIDVRADGDPTISRIIHVRDSVFQLASSMSVWGVVLVMAPWSSDVYDLNQFSAHHNLYDITPAAEQQYLQYHSAKLSFATAVSLLGESSWTRASAGFVDAAAGNFSLRSDSPALGKASDGGDSGALPFQLSGPVVSIVQAIGIRWPSRLGARYQLQSSPDLVSWADSGAVIDGDGNTMTVYLDRAPSLATFFRVRVL